MLCPGPCESWSEIEPETEDAVLKPDVLQEFYKAVYADEKVLEKYHRETTGDQTASVSEWRDAEDGARQQRTVKYSVPLAVPIAIKRLIGPVLANAHCVYSSLDMTYAMATLAGNAKS